MAKRYIPKVRVRRLVRNKSSRNGVKPSIIVLHSTESNNLPGTQDLVNLGAWFDNPAAQASSNVAVDAEGNSARFVRDQDKAWTQARYNPYSLSIEAVGRASQTFWPREQYREIARWVAYWSKRHDIPLRRGKVAGGGVIKSGIVTHNDLGAEGGDHHDPGGFFRVTLVLGLAAIYRRHL